MQYKLDSGLGLLEELSSKDPIKIISTSNTTLVC